MRRCSLFVALAIAAALGGSPLEAHPGHKHLVAAGTGALSASGARSTVPDGISGQGAMRFRVLYASERLPDKAREVLASAHGGFFASARTFSRSTC